MNEVHVFTRLMKDPTGGFIGWIMKHLMIRQSWYIEEKAVRVLNIKPHHRVLEVGFGPGIGLLAAYRYIKGGEGRLYGIDSSQYMCDVIRKKMSKEIDSGQVEIHTGNVISLPFVDSIVDRVFHTNVFYYWDNPLMSAAEIFRIMRPNGLMVTGLCLDRLKISESKKQISLQDYDPIEYMAMLEFVGFSDVFVEYFKHRSTRFQIIFARADKSTT